MWKSLYYFSPNGASYYYIRQIIAQIRQKMQRKTYKFPIKEIE